jgi:hypothetical protein
MKHFCKSSSGVRLWRLNSAIFILFWRGASVRLARPLKGTPLIPTILGAMVVLVFMPATKVLAQNNGCSDETTVTCQTTAQLALLPPNPGTNVVCLGSPISMSASISNTAGTLLHTAMDEDCNPTNWTTAYNCSIVSEGWTASDTSGFSTSGTNTLTASFTPPNCGHGTITYFVTYNSSPCSTNNIPVSVTGIYDAVSLQSVTVMNAAQIDSTNWWAVMTTGTNTDYVYVTANVCPNLAEATNVISISGGGPVPGNPFQRKVPKWVSAETTVTVTGCTNTNVVKVWIVWGSISYNFSSSLDPDDSLSFANWSGFSLPNPTSAGTYIGLVNGNSVMLAINKVEIIGTLTPAGIGKLLTSGFSINPQLIDYYVWSSDGTRNGGPLSSVTDSTAGTHHTGNDTPLPQTTSPVNDKVFALDAPGNGENVPTTGYDALAVNFTNYIHLGGVVISDPGLWYCHARSTFSGSSVSATPCTAGSGNPTLPTTWGDTNW